VLSCVTTRFIVSIRPFGLLRQMELSDFHAVEGEKLRPNLLEATEYPDFAKLKPDTCNTKDPDVGTTSIVVKLRRLKFSITIEF
jgi:hypothetical protein